MSARVRRGATDSSAAHVFAVVRTWCVLPFRVCLGTGSEHSDEVRRTGGFDDREKQHFKGEQRGGERERESAIALVLSRHAVKMDGRPPALESIVTRQELELLRDRSWSYFP
jgi:hypothetical protein